MVTTCLKNGTCNCLKTLRDELWSERDKLTKILENKEERDKMTDEMQLIDFGTVRCMNIVIDKIEKLLEHKSIPLWTVSKK